MPEAAIGVPMSAPAATGCGKSVIRFCTAQSARLSLLGSDCRRMTSDGCESFSEILRQLNLKIQTRLLMVMLITLG